MIGNSQTNDKKNIVLTFSLLMRLFEWCHEDAVNDVAMHKVMEKLMAFTDGKNALDIQVYKSLIDGANDGEVSEEETQNKEMDQEEGKVDSNFADYIQNIHDSYYEGGITGDDAKACINNYYQDETMDNQIDYEGMAHCCHEGAPIDYEGMEEYQNQMNNCCHKGATFDDYSAETMPSIDQYCQSYNIPTNMISVDADGNIEIGCKEVQETPCETCPVDVEIDEIIKLAKF